MRFSQRIGKRPVRTALQIDSIDKALANRLWNVLLEDFLNQLNDYNHENETERGAICKYIWTEFFGNRVDEIPELGSGRVWSLGVIGYISDWFFEQADWLGIYDLINFVSEIDEHYDTGFIGKCNRALETEMSGYRIINYLLVPITSEEEILSIEEALEDNESMKAVTTHLSKALEFLADRQNPDYRNSIKEAISSVEAFCKFVVNDDKATLGKALAAIEKQYQLHSSLKEAYSKIYGYTSDADGIRHAMLEDGVKIEFEDAKFMLVSCTAFINYLKVKLKL